MASDQRVSSGRRRRSARQGGCVVAREEVNVLRRGAWLVLTLCLAPGCASVGAWVAEAASPRLEAASLDEISVAAQSPSASDEETEVPVPRELDGEAETAPDPADAATAEEMDGPESLQDPIELGQVLDSIYQSFPLLEVAYLGRNAAWGENLSAQGEFDLKLKGESANTPEGYYETYRQAAGFEQPLFGGGSVFGGYRIGRGSFEPWYLERQTNEGGEFKLGFSVPLWQNRRIDERRAELWRTAYNRDLVEPEIRAQLLFFIREGSVAYWEWVGAGAQYRYATQLQNLAQVRDAQLRRQVEQGDRPEADLTDNERLIVSRRVKLLDAQRKLQTSAAKLSLYLRLADGAPFVPAPRLLPRDFPNADPVQPENVESDIAYAQSRRPELSALDVTAQILNVDLQQAYNLLQPELNAIVANSKDVGAPTSSKKDKSPYELEGGVVLSVPLQRRKARGKIGATEAKLAQLRAKRRFTADKISVEVRSAVVALDTAYQSISQAREAVRLNAEMQRFETIRLEQGDSDFLRLNLREQATFDARVAEVDALVRYFEAQADYRAALAADVPAADDPAAAP